MSTGFWGNFLTMRRFLIFLPPNCSRNVLFPTSAATDFNFFFPVRTIPLSSEAISSKSTPTPFAAGTTYVLKSENSGLPIACAYASNPLPLCVE